MKFDRTDLIARVEAEIARREQAAAERNAEAQKTYEQNRQKYLDHTSEAWKQFADRIRLRLRNKQPISVKDIPQEIRGDRNYGYVSTWDNDPPVERAANTEALTTLLDLLKASTDDEVTVASLQRLGFRLSELFPGR